MLTITGCRTREAVPEGPLPPNTVLLSGMMRELSARAGFTDDLLKQLGGIKHGKKGPALLTPDLINELRKRILGRDWQGLDRFPGWTMREINPTVRVATHFAGKDPKLEGISAVHPGSAPQSMADRQARVFLDLGPYALDEAGIVSLDAASTLPPSAWGMRSRGSARLSCGVMAPIPWRRSTPHRSGSPTCSTDSASTPFPERSPLP